MGGEGDVGQDGGDVGVGELAVKAVGGEQVDVAGLGLKGLDVYVYGGLGAHGAGDVVAHGGTGGFGGGDLSGADLLLDEGVVEG